MLVQKVTRAKLFVPARYKYQGVIISFLIDVSTEGLLSVSTVSNFFHCQHSVLFIVSTRFFPLKGGVTRPCARARQAKRVLTQGRTGAYRGVQGQIA